MNDVIPFEDFADYAAEDFIEDHAIETVGDEEEESDVEPKNHEYDDDQDDFEPSSKRFKSEYDAYDNDGSNDSRYGPGIPSLLNLNVNPPRRGQESKNVPMRSPGSPWEPANLNNNNGGSQNSNKPQANNDRREGRRGSSRWSSRR